MKQKEAETTLSIPSAWKPDIPCVSSGVLPAREQPRLKKNKSYAASGQYLFLECSPKKNPINRITNDSRETPRQPPNQGPRIRTCQAPAHPQMPVNHHKTNDKK